MESAEEAALVKLKIIFRFIFFCFLIFVDVDGYVAAEGIRFDCRVVSGRSVRVQGVQGDCRRVPTRHFCCFFDLMVIVCYAGGYIPRLDISQYIVNFR